MAFAEPSCARALYPVIPWPSAFAKAVSNRHEYAGRLPHPTASSLTFIANILPRIRTRPIPVSSAIASFARIRTNVSVNRPLRTLSTQRMVKSTKPLSIRDRVEYQRRLLNPRVFNPTKTSRVIGPSIFPERKPAAKSRFAGEPTIRITHSGALKRPVNIDHI